MFAGLMLGFGAPAGAINLDAKPGVWEMTHTVERSGNTLPKEVLEKMPPDQRARAEAAMRDEVADGVRKLTRKRCMSAEDLAEDVILQKRDSCKYEFTTRTTSKLEGTIACGGDQSNLGEFKIEVIDGDKLNGRMQVTNAEARVVFQMQGRWISAPCTGQEQ